jgi:hypothetical protein
MLRGLLDERDKLTVAHLPDMTCRVDSIINATNNFSPNMDDIKLNKFMANFYSNWPFCLKTGSIDNVQGTISDLRNDIFYKYNYEEDATEHTVQYEINDKRTVPFIKHIEFVINDLYDKGLLNTLLIKEGKHYILDKNLTPGFTSELRIVAVSDKNNKKPIPALGIRKGFLIKKWQLTPIIRPTITGKDNTPYVTYNYTKTDTNDNYDYTQADYLYKTVKELLTAKPPRQNAAAIKFAADAYAAAKMPSAPKLPSAPKPAVLPAALPAASPAALPVASPEALPAAPIRGRSPSPREQPPPAAAESGKGLNRVKAEREKAAEKKRRENEAAAAAEAARKAAAARVSKAVSPDRAEASRIEKLKIVGSPNASALVAARGVSRTPSPERAAAAAALAAKREASAAARARDEQEARQRRLGLEYTRELKPLSLARPNVKPNLPSNHPFAVKETTEQQYRQMLGRLGVLKKEGKNTRELERQLNELERNHPNWKAKGGSRTRKQKAKKSSKKITQKRR